MRSVLQHKGVQPFKRYFTMQIDFLRIQESILVFLFFILFSDNEILANFLRDCISTINIVSGLKNS